jgi:predicted O-methyltransferase YrrM
MDIVKFNEIKEKALEEKVPIIMDETLEKISETIGERTLSNILEIGTAVRVFCYLFF